MKKILILFFTLSIFAQQNDNNFIGVLSVDSKIAGLENNQDNIPENTLQPVQKKSGFLAGALSFAVPGAGEFYSESYLKAAIFFAVEVAAVSGAIIYNQKGDDKTSEFEDYADQHWNVQQYAQWTKNRFEQNFQNSAKYDFSNGVDWKVLNEMEEEVGRTLEGRYYSHKLAPKGDQQYYEMIGKYKQFNVGWDDFPGGVNGSFDYYNDKVTQRFDEYSNMRGKANDYYNIASTAVIIVVANHILSAADAVWSASRYNKSVSAKVSLEKTNYGFVIDYHPELNLQIRF